LAPGCIILSQPATLFGQVSVHSSEAGLLQRLTIDVRGEPGASRHRKRMAILGLEWQVRVASPIRDHEQAPKVHDDFSVGTARVVRRQSLEVLADKIIAG